MFIVVFLNYDKETYDELIAEDTSVTSSQLRFISKLAKEKKIPKETLRAYSSVVFDKSSSRDLSSYEAYLLIKKLKSIEIKRKIISI